MGETTVARVAVVAVGAPVAAGVVGAGAPVVADAVRQPHRVVAVVVAVSSLPKAGVLADGVARDRVSVIHVWVWQALSTCSGQGEEEYAAAKRRRQDQKLRPHAPGQLPNSNRRSWEVGYNFVTTFAAA